MVSRGLAVMRQRQRGEPEVWGLADGPERLKTEKDFQAEQELCFGDIDFDLYAEQEEDLQHSGPNAPYGLNQSRLLTPEGETLLFRRLSFVKIRAEALRSTLKTGKAANKKLLEIQQLEKQYQETRNEIAQANLRLVASVARKLANSSDDFDDMFAEGNTILLYAIDKFDYTRGYRFSTYLTHAVQRHLFRQMKRKATRKGRERTAEADHLAELTGQSIDLDALKPEEELAIAHRIIESIDQTLDERERLIVRGRLGLDKSRKAQTFQTIGEQLGLSKERTRQLFQRAVEKLEQAAAPYAEMFS